MQIQIRQRNRKETKEQKTDKGTENRKRELSLIVVARLLVGLGRAHFKVIIVDNVPDGFKCWFLYIKRNNKILLYDNNQNYDNTKRRYTASS